MPQLNLDNLQEHLKKDHSDVQVQAETQQVFYLENIEGHELPLFIRIMEEGDFLQLITFFPFNIKNGTQGDLARALHLLNKELDIPGFGLDETSSLVFFRAIIPCVDKVFDVTLLDRYLNAVKMIASTFFHLIHALTQGAVGFQEVAAKISQMMNNHPPA